MTDGRSASGVPALPGWRVIVSDVGRLWASREAPFPLAAEEAGALRTVDGDDAAELAAAVAEQEHRAKEVS
ncbi:hypothetical protein [Microtetraspora malaysiensis]|uniref:Uncharacterized protein n=1 Tax=Microtetraspora malaysiensis TaxID=161358 RepID=A0ABW6T3X9_9ACTN